MLTFIGCGSGTVHSEAPFRIFGSTGTRDTIGCSLAKRRAACSGVYHAMETLNGQKGDENPCFMWKSHAETEVR